MSTLVGVKKTNRSQAMRIGGKQISSTAITYVNVDSPRVIRDINRHNSITGLAIGVGAAHFAPDDGVVVIGGKVTTRATGLVLDVSKTEYTTAAGVVRTAPAGTATVGAADATNPRLDIIAINTTNDTLVTIAGTPTAGSSVTNRRGLADLPANRIELAWVQVPATATNLAQSAVTDVRP